MSCFSRGIYARTVCPLRCDPYDGLLDRSASRVCVFDPIMINLKQMLVAPNILLKRVYTIKPPGGQGWCRTDWTLEQPVACRIVARRPVLHRPVAHRPVVNRSMIGCVSLRCVSLHGVCLICLTLRCVNEYLKCLSPRCMSRICLSPRCQPADMCLSYACLEDVCN